MFFAVIAPFRQYAQTYKVEEVTIRCTTFPAIDLNSKYDDFCATIVNDQLIFSSGRETSLVLAGENNWKKTGHTNLFVCPLPNGYSDTTQYKQISAFSNQLRNSSHTGPATFTASGDTIFYTQMVVEKKLFRSVLKPQLFSALKSGDEWISISLLPFNDIQYNFGHPWWDARSNALYFVSDMPGGKGGKDIYRIHLNGGSWSAVENVAEINSEADELFPAVVSGDIYFSSNRTGGKGGLDIWWKIIGGEQATQNLTDLNTPSDEVGIYVSPDRKKGFYSSNADGNDDLFFFYMDRRVTLLNELAGQFTFRNLQTVAGGLTVQLYTEEGDLVFEQETNEEGQFKFRSLPGETYTIKALSEENLELVIYNEEGEPSMYLLRDNLGAFQYKKIDYENAGTLALMNESDIDFSLEQGWVSGQFAYESDPGKFPDSLKVMLTNDDGQPAYVQYTDDRGNFEFRNLSLQTNYLLTTEDIDQDLVLFVYDKNGNVIAQLKQNELGNFTYRKIKSDFATNLHALAEGEDVFEFNTMTLTGNFNYKKLDGDFGKGLEVMLYNEEGEYLMSAFTDENGQFRFSSLDPTVNYLFAINEENLPFELSEFNLLVTDRYGNTVTELFRGEDKFFTYKRLQGSSQQALQSLTEKNDDFSLTVQKVDADAIVILFDKNSSYPSATEYLKLRPVIDYLKKNPGSKVAIAAYADSRSTDEYNMFLSERRGNRIKDYMLRHGVKPSQVQVMAFGESKLINACDDQANCPEEEHAKNRRVEIVLQP